MNPVMATWQVTNLSGGLVPVFPDGCQDIIWVHVKGSAPYWKLAALDTTVRYVKGFAGAEMIGHRLAPATQIPGTLLPLLDPEKPDEALQRISDHCHRSVAAAEMLAAVARAPEVGVAKIAQRFGASARTMQRVLWKETGQTPLFWARLARLRAAFTAARSGMSIAEAAFEAGFSDQSHFTREARGFYGRPPKRLLADDHAMSLVLAPGL